MMMDRTKVMAIVIVAVGIGFGGMMLLPTAKIAQAQSTTSDTANHFGQGASQLGQSGDMGTHAGSTQGGGEQTQPRSGIGNVGQDILGCDQKIKPGQLADLLNGQGTC